MVGLLVAPTTLRVEISSASCPDSMSCRERSSSHTATPASDNCCKGVVFMRFLQHWGGYGRGGCPLFDNHHDAVNARRWRLEFLSSHCCLARSAVPPGCLLRESPGIAGRFSYAMVFWAAA